MTERPKKLNAARGVALKAVYVLMSKPPGAQSDFIELEDGDGKGVGGVPWVEEEPGKWVLGPLYLPEWPK